MWRFGKAKHVDDIWEQPIEWPIGDIEAAHRIRDICRSAADSAERVGKIKDGAGNTSRKEAERDRYATERYERAARAAMQIAMKISDDLMRDDAVRQILELCLAAKEIKTARILFRAIQAASIRNEVLKECPVLQAE
jgi:hypothetical protein